MKKQITYGVLLMSLLLSSTVTVFAEDNTQMGARKNIRENAQTEMDRIKKIAHDRLDALKNKIASTTEQRKLDKENNIEKENHGMQKHMENRFDAMNQRFEATIERIRNIATRLEARIEKIKNAGGDTAVAAGFVTNANTTLDTAKVMLSAIKSQTDLIAQTENTEHATSTTNDAKTNMIGLMKMSKDLRQSLKQAQESLVKAVINLKGFSTTTKGNTATSSRKN